MKKLAISFLLLLLALTIISCGGNTPDTTTGTASEDTTADTTSDTAADTSETAPASDGPVQVTTLGTIKPEIQIPFEEAVATYNESQDQYEVVIVPRDNDPLQMMTAFSPQNVAILQRHKKN